MGLVMVFTGDGKGKTTAALGMALRSVGHDMKTVVIQFLKGGTPSGEAVAAERFLPGVSIVQAGRPGFLAPGGTSPQDRELAKEALAAVAALFADGGYDLVIMDEVNVAIRMGLLSVDEVLEVLAQRRSEQHVVLTGRWAPPQLVEAADTVSEIREVKHHFRQGIMAQPGIEF